MFPNAKRGFGLVAAIFVLVILASVGAYLVSIVGVVSRSADFSLLTAQAQMAAKSGLEWGSYNWSQGIACSDTPTIFYFTNGSLNGFKVTISIPCTIDSLGRGFSTHEEDSDNYEVCIITSKAEFGIFGDPDYVSRELSSFQERKI